MRTPMDPSTMLLDADIPDAGEEWNPAPADRPDRPGPMRAARILVVDDEPIVRSFIARLLEEQGYTVQVAVDGAEALHIAGADPVGFDLVISDVRMPRVDGWQLGRLMRERWPRLPMLYISGYDLEQNAPRAAFLRKPFDPSELLRRVAHLLRGT